MRCLQFTDLFKQSNEGLTWCSDYYQHGPGEPLMVHLEFLVDHKEFH